MLARFSLASLERGKSESGSNCSVFLSFSHFGLVRRLIFYDHFNFVRRRCCGEVLEPKKKKTVSRDSKALPTKFMVCAPETIIDTIRRVHQANPRILPWIFCSWTERFHRTSTRVSEGPNMEPGQCDILFSPISLSLLVYHFTYN